MPGLDGQQLVSETTFRPPKRCRVLVEVEVEVSAAGFAEMPRYLRDSTDYMRRFIDENDLELSGPVVDLLLNEAVTVVKTQVVVSK